MYIGLLVSQVRHLQSGSHPHIQADTHPESSPSHDTPHPHRFAGLWLKIKHMFV